MSRIGKLPVPVPSGVEVTVNGQLVKAKGKKGELEVTLVNEVTAEFADNQVKVTPINEERRSRMMWGMSRTLVNNIVLGVSEGFTKKLEIKGVGYRAQLKGKNLVMQLGYSHDVIFPVPEGIEIKVPAPTQVEISGADKQKVGQVAAKIRGFRPPEPYKGKGVKYADEIILRKEGKKK